MKRTWSFLAPVTYVLAVLVLFQFISVQIVLGFYENPVTIGSLTINPLVRMMPAKANRPTNIGLPIRLKIPSIHVNAVINPVGLTAEGAMGVPKLPRDTAWYMLGPKPGQVGSAVIAGHVNWLYGAKGVFEHLNDLKKGDLITVLDSQGASSTFAVREVRAIGQKEDATAVFSSYDGKSHLNLVTCSGIWDKAARIYSKRLVVFADKVN